MLASASCETSVSVKKGATGAAPRKKKRSDYWPVFFFMSFMLHESPPQQDSCLSEDAFIV